MTEAATTRLRLTAFAALAAFTAAHWVSLVQDPPAGRTAIAVLCAIAGAAMLAAIGARVPSRWRAALLGAVASLAILAAVALAVGLPARMLAPPGWGELLGNLGDGLGSLGGADYPYAGGDSWSRLALLLALAPLLALAAALSFWPGRVESSWRHRLALALLLLAYGTAVTVSPPSRPLLQGLALFILVVAWVWLPSLARRGSLGAGVLVLGAGLAAMPLAGLLDASQPWIDYRSWDWSGSPLGRTESFDWNHSYGPLDWQRDGRSLLEVRSSAGHYWATAVLDDFDGYRWVSTPEGSAVDLPLGRDGSPAPLRRKWMVSARVQVRALSSQLLPGAGTVLSVSGLVGARRTAEGVAVPQTLSEDDSYAFRSYVPQPSPRQMRDSEGPYPRRLAQYTTIHIPHSHRLPPPPESVFAPKRAVTIQEVEAPLRAGGSAPESPALVHSPYGGVYRLARRLAIGQPTAYDVARAVQGYLGANYRYDESSPKRGYPLRAFLFRDRMGYCQQFSGAMALMLRMDGIPSRVVGGFAPGRQTRSGFLVSDLDAHSWVEVYFNRIGWVTFDPTPSAAPAVSDASKVAAALGRPRGLAFRTGPSTPSGAAATRHVHSGSSAPSLLWIALALLGLAALVPPAIVARNLAHRRSLSMARLVEAQALELRSAVGRLRQPLPPGTTLRGLERWLGVPGSPAAAYAAGLRECRYANRGAPPGVRERRAARRALAAERGLRGRLRAWMAMPPGGPAPPRSREPRPRR